MRLNAGENPLFEFHNVLLKQFQNLKNGTSDVSYCITPSRILKLILHNNGCQVDNMVYAIDNIKSLGDGYEIIFAYNSMGNGSNIFFDYVEIYNTKILVIFMDHFKNMFEPRKPISEGIETLTDRSQYFEAIIKISNVFIETFAPMAEIMGSLSATSAATLYRLAPTFIAGNILIELADFTEDDAPGGATQITDLINKTGIKLLLCGIREK